jgi:hypothetical protein
MSNGWDNTNSSLSVMCKQGLFNSGRSSCLATSAIGYRYRYLFLHDLAKGLVEVPLAVRPRMWYMHDGPPEHFRRAVRDALSNTLHGL